MHRGPHDLQVLRQRRLASEIAKTQLRDPVKVLLTSTRPAFPPHVAAQEELAQPMPGTGQILTRVLTSANKVAKRFLLGGGDANE
jgi:hypothetical protein